MSSHIAMLRLTIAMTLIASAPADADDVTVQPAAGSGFVVMNAGGTQLRLRVDENGNIVIPVLVNGAQQNLPVCVGGSGQIGPCAPGGGSGSSYTAATGLTLTGTTFAVAPTYQLPQSCAANQVPQWSGAAWGCVALPSGSSAFALPYAGSTSSAAAAFAITSSGGDALNGFTNQAANSGVYGNNSGGGKGVFGVSGSGNGIEGGSTSGSGVKGVTKGTSGESGAAAVWGDTHDYFGVWGTSVTADGVHGDSQTSSGVFGGSHSGAGVWGESQGYDAIHGHTSNPAGNTSGVAGFGDGGNNGVAGISSNGSGVFGTSNSGAGVWGESTLYDGVHGHAANINGGASGVAGFGESKNNGVAGFSTSGSGVFGHSLYGYGMATDGDAQQARGNNGWVKAMALIDNGSGAIIRCFNSQLPAAQASVPPCGFSVDASQTGLPIVDFGFQVDDRFISVIPQWVGDTQNCPGWDYGTGPFHIHIPNPFGGDCKISPTLAMFRTAIGNQAAFVTSDANGVPVKAGMFVFVY